MTGVLRGFDPFMNIVLDEAVENVSSSEKNEVGMVVSLCSCILQMGNHREIPIKLSVYIVPEKY